MPGSDGNLGKLGMSRHRGYLTPDQVDSLKKGRLYVQISSEKSPEGTLWGWILK
jgi:hypothetical protein